VTPPVLASIHAAAFTDPRPWSAAEFTTLLAGPGVFLGAEGRGFVVGRVILDEAEVLTIAVSPEAQGQGLGQRLMAEFAAKAVARGAVRGYLEVAAHNAAARAVYARAGWAECGRRKGYYHLADGTPTDAVLMACTFAQPTG